MLDRHLGVQTSHLESPPSVQTPCLSRDAVSLSGGKLDVVVGGYDRAALVVIQHVVATVDRADTVRSAARRR